MSRFDSVLGLIQEIEHLFGSDVAWEAKRNAIRSGAPALQQQLAGLGYELEHEDPDDVSSYMEALRVVKQEIQALLGLPSTK